MSQSIQPAQEHMLFPSGFGNASSLLETSGLTPELFADVSQSKFVWAASFLLLLGLARVFISGRQKLPPGVKALPRLPGLPYAGRFWDVPAEGVKAAWHFGALHKKYGPIYEWKVMGTIHIWVETDKIARDLFVTRQRKYCDRNVLPAAVKVKYGSELLPLMGYGDAFRRYKNFMHLIMKQSKPAQFYGYPVLENKKTLRRLIESPEQWSEHMIVHCARTIASVAWGDPAHGTKLLTMVPYLLKTVSPAGPIINKLTFLQNLPESISPFKQEETKQFARVRDAFYEALQDVKDRIAAGTAEDSWSKLWLDGENKEKANISLNWHEAAHAIGSSSFVAIATIGGPLHCFFTAMCHYPSWQTRVQEEIDRVCGDRLPTVEDMPQLPMLRATVKEILRWRQPTPLGVPHVALEDDVYDGYFIPKDAIVHANHYLISRDEEMYPDPTEFKPERFIDPSYPTYKEPLTEFPNLRGDTSFGYGNRACPGVDLTNHELVTLLGALLWSFTVKRKEGAEGLANPVPWYETNPYVITMSKPFACDITVRSEEKRRYIMDGCPDAGYVVKKSEDERKDQWDIVRPENEQVHYSWEGLTARFEKPDVMPTYPAGV